MRPSATASATLSSLGGERSHAQDWNRPILRRSLGAQCELAQPTPTRRAARTPTTPPPTAAGHPALGGASGESGQGTARLHACLERRCSGRVKRSADQRFGFGVGLTRVGPGIDTGRNGGVVGRPGRRQRSSPDGAPAPQQHLPSDMASRRFSAQGKIGLSASPRFLAKAATSSRWSMAAVGFARPSSRRPSALWA